MNSKKIVQYALEEGFYSAAVVDTKEIVFDSSFRVYCEDNLCGQYGVNYSCPPVCGSPEEMRDRILKHKHALVLQTIWPIFDYNDKEAVKRAKKEHNRMTLNLVKQLREKACDGIIVGASGCALCNPCALMKEEECRFPEWKYSCMSAYCIYVSKLAEICDMDYTCDKNGLAFFGMYVFD